MTIHYIVSSQITGFKFDGPILLTAKCGLTQIVDRKDEPPQKEFFANNDKCDCPNCLHKINADRD